MEAIRHAEQQAELAFRHGILRALVAFRWLTLTWAIAGVVISREHLDRPWWAVLLLGLPLLFTIGATWTVARRPNLLAHPAAMILELTIGAVALLGDGFVFNPARAQSLIWAWPAAAIITVGVIFGSRLGACSAVALGIASYLGDARNSQDSWGVAASSKTALYVLGAVVAGYVARRLRETEVEITAARARAEVARTLHDGVLQTLAVVQRRSSDPELATLAREQERDLRDYLFGVEAAPRSLAVALREIANTTQKRFDLDVSVVTAEDLPLLPPNTIEAVTGAVGEALTNVGKHAQATSAVVYAEPDNAGLFCSVKDNGIGFDIESVERGQGINSSIEARMRDLGGRAAITSRIGAGTEVQLWIST